jgi:hypothetical protein
LGATRDVGTSFEVSEHSGDFWHFKAGSAIVQLFLQDGELTGELCDLGLDNVALLMVFSVAEYLSMYCPLVQGVRRRCEYVEPHSWSTEELEEPGGHGFSRGGWVIGREVELCNVDWFLCFPSCQHLHLSIAQPADVSGDNLESLFRGDRAVDAPVVGLEPWGYLDVSQSTFEGGDAFIVLGHALLFCQDMSLALAHVLGVLLRVAMNGGDEAVSCGPHSFINVVLFEEDVLGGFGR